MKDIIKIVIKGSSGYCCDYEAFNDKVIITSEFISYEYIPKIESENNAKIKWSYRTNNHNFKIKYNNITNIIADIINRKIEEVCTDIGGIEFNITYSDKTKLKKAYWVPSSYFQELFLAVKCMVPESECTPLVLK